MLACLSQLSGPNLSPLLHTQGLMHVNVRPFMCSHLSTFFKLSLLHKFPAGILATDQNASARVLGKCRAGIKPIDESSLLSATDNRYQQLIITGVPFPLGAICYRYVIFDGVCLCAVGFGSSSSQKGWEM